MLNRSRKKNSANTIVILTLADRVTVESCTLPVS